MTLTETGRENIRRYRNQRTERDDVVMISARAKRIDVFVVGQLVSPLYLGPFGSLEQLQQQLGSTGAEPRQVEIPGDPELERLRKQFGD